MSRASRWCAGAIMPLLDLRHCFGGTMVTRFSGDFSGIWWVPSPRAVAYYRCRSFQPTNEQHSIHFNLCFVYSASQAANGDFFFRPVITLRSFRPRFLLSPSIHCISYELCYTHVDAADSMDMMRFLFMINCYGHYAAWVSRFIFIGARYYSVI